MRQTKVRDDEVAIGPDHCVSEKNTGQGVSGDRAEKDGARTGRDRTGQKWSRGERSGKERDGEG